MYVQNQAMYIQNQAMYVQNQAMYVQNQDIYPFFQDNLNDPWHISNAQVIVRRVSCRI